MVPNPADALNANYIEKIRSDERRAADAKVREGEMPLKKPVSTVETAYQQLKAVTMVDCGSTR